MNRPANQIATELAEEVSSELARSELARNESVSPSHVTRRLSASAATMIAGYEDHAPTMNENIIEIPDLFHTVVMNDLVRNQGLNIAFAETVFASIEAEETATQGFFELGEVTTVLDTDFQET
jgi:hypothetical protein